MKSNEHTHKRHPWALWIAGLVILAIIAYFAVKAAVWALAVIGLIAVAVLAVRLSVRRKRHAT
jgi:uncharacterized membrane protein